MHGQFWEVIEKENASNQNRLWAKDGKIEGSAEATVMAIQDGVLLTSSGGGTVEMGRGRSREGVTPPPLSPIHATSINLLIYN